LLQKLFRAKKLTLLPKASPKLVFFKKTEEKSCTNKILLNTYTFKHLLKN